MTRVVQRRAALVLMVCSLLGCMDCAAAQSAPQTGAEAFILMDAGSGRVLSGKNTERELAIASTAKSMTAHAMRAPTCARIAATRTAAVGERMLGNHNKLLASLEGCTGLKTGYTDNAGRTLVTCCERDGMRLIAVTLNDRSDWADHAALYEYGFAAFARKRAVARGEEYTLAPVRGGTQTSVLLAAGESFFYPVTAGEELLVSARLPEELTAPLTAGQAVGELIVSMDGEELARVPLVCAEPVAAAEKMQSLFERLFIRSGGWTSTARDCCSSPTTGHGCSASCTRVMRSKRPMRSRWRERSRTRRRSSPRCAPSTESRSRPRGCVCCEKGRKQRSCPSPSMRGKTARSGGCVQRSGCTSSACAACVSTPCRSARCRRAAGAS